MSGLVAYESSSDEDEQTAKASTTTQSVSNISQSSHDINGTVEDQDKHIQPKPSNESTQEIQRPLIGPIAPSAANDYLQDYDSPSEQVMSERDTIRSLTQASHPATSLPPSPPGSPDPNASLKIKRFLELKAKGIHFNEDLAQKSAFRNPGLLDTLTIRAGLDNEAQYSSSLPPIIWDPSDLPKVGYKEELLKSQQDIRDQDTTTKKMLSASGKRTIEFTSGSGSGNSSRNSTPGQFSKKRRP